MLTEDELNDIIRKSNALSVFVQKNVDKEVTFEIQLEFEILFKDLSITLDSFSKKYKISTDLITMLAEEKAENDFIEPEKTDKTIKWVKTRIACFLKYREINSSQGRN